MIFYNCDSETITVVFFKGGVGRLIIIDYSARTPIFEQIKEQIIFLIQKGALNSGDKLPSIRSLASELGVNVNTVKRAFSDLEESGVVYSEAGRGVFISENALNNEAVKKEAGEAVLFAVRAACSKGMTREEVNALIDLIYDNIDL